MDNLITGAGAGGGGIIGAMLAWFGFKSKIQNIERRIDVLSGNVRYKDTCEEIQKAAASYREMLNRRLENIESAQNEAGKDIKTILGKIAIVE